MILSFLRKLKIPHYIKIGDSGDHDLKSGIDTQVSFVLAINLSPSKIDTSTSFVPKYSNDTFELS